MTIDFMKWLVDKAEGFEMSDSGQWIKHIRNQDISTAEFVDVYKPLLLQRAIEGANRDDEHCMAITVYPESVDAHTIDDGKCFIWRKIGTIDQAKEAALQWVKENEG